MARPRGGGGGTRSENWWGCAAGRWNLDPKRSREKWNLGPKRSNSVTIGSFNTPKDCFGVGGWKKIPQKDRVQSSECQERGQKRRHIHITQHRGSSLPGGSPMRVSHGVSVVRSKFDLWSTLAIAMVHALWCHNWVCYKGHLMGQGYTMTLTAVHLRNKYKGNADRGLEWLWVISAMSYYSLKYHMNVITFPCPKLNVDLY